MMTITPVQVVNLPTETTGELKVQPTKTTVLDLLEAPITLNFGDGGWTSEPFSVEQYNRLGARIAGAGSGNSCGISTSGTQYDLNDVKVLLRRE
jgi:hypothetical protein